ncbi:MAG: DUF349 domain-containing protein [Bacteroidia bacterium]|nr:DUF349 domain-containing protein [Bacteroidia bacterium]
MLPAYEFPEYSADLPEDENTVVEPDSEEETSTPVPPKNEDSQEDVTPANEEETSNEESTPAAEEEAPQTEEEVQAEETEVEETEVEETEAKDVTPTEDSGTEEKAPEAESASSNDEEVVAAAEEGKEEAPQKEEEAPVSHVETVPEGIEEDLWNKMKEILAGEKSNQQILTEAKLEDLNKLLDHFTADSRILRHIPRVGLVKRTFDALKYKEELSDDQANTFQEKLAAFNKNRVEAQKVVEDQKKENARLKSDLLETLKEIVAKEDPMLIKEVREIQDKWREIGQVPRDQMDALYKTYRSNLDDFYKRRELHFEMLDYDRKKNLRDKESLIQEAKTLIPPEDQREDSNLWKEKMDILTDIQQKWKSIGHVPREEMERINNDYRSTIDQFFEVRSIFLGKLDEERGENAERKEALLIEMAKFAEFQAERPKSWNEATRELKEYQDKWKEIGQAAYAINNDLWNRYRAICDAFFSNKSEFFKKFDEFRAENLEKKRKLCERAEELAQSNEWEKSAKELKQLQKDWKAIGPVPERHSNKLWNRFRAACDAFFEGRRSHYQKMHEGEYANLDAKKVLIEEVKKLTEGDTPNIDEAIERVKGIQAEWKSIGKVPYKEKDKIWEVFRKQVDEFFNGLSAKRSKMRDMAMNVKLDDITDDKQRNSAIKERIKKIRRRISQAQSNVDQYSTNIQFISKGKSGDALRNQIQGQIDKEKEQIKEWKDKIKELNELAKNPPKKEVAPQETETEATPKEVEASAESTEEVVEAAASEEAGSEEEAPKEEAPATEGEDESKESEESTEETETKD